MNARAMKREIFYGWAVLAAAFVIITLSIGTLFTLGVFLKPIEDPSASDSGPGRGTCPGPGRLAAALSGAALSLTDPRFFVKNRPLSAAGFLGIFQHLVMAFTRFRPRRWAHPPRRWKPEPLRFGGTRLHDEWLISQGGRAQ